jgi:hypothetical protein
LTIIIFYLWLFSFGENGLRPDSELRLPRESENWKRVPGKGRIIEETLGRKSARCKKGPALPALAPSTNDRQGSKQDTARGEQGIPFRQNGGR